MPTIKLPEESQHNDMVKKVDAMIREITKAPSMTASTRALGLRPSILIGEHQELAHIMAKRGLLNLQNHMIGLAVAAARCAPYELYAHTRSLQLDYGLDSGQIVELAATVAHVTSINLFEKAIVSTTIHTTTGETLYVHFGEWVVLLSCLALIGAAVVAVVRVRSRRGA